MPIDWVTLGAALLAGLAGSVHCAAMCGGIAAGIGMQGVRTPLRSALLANAGRLGGYVLMGALVGGIGSGLIALTRIDALVWGFRLALGLLLVVTGLRIVGVGPRGGFALSPPAPVADALARARRALLPAHTAPRQFALGLLWGWLPCGLSYSLLGAAWLSATAINGALVMLAFGAGTLLTMLPLTWSGARLQGVLARRGTRMAAGALVIAAGLLTLSAPWLAKIPALHGALEALGCLPPR